jgi:uncharacterized protein (DUF3084 family)
LNEKIVEQAAKINAQEIKIFEQAEAIRLQDEKLNELFTQIDALKNEKGSSTNAAFKIIGLAVVAGFLFKYIF